MPPKPASLPDKKSKKAPLHLQGLSLDDIDHMSLDTPIGFREMTEEQKQAYLAAQAAASQPKVPIYKKYWWILAISGFLLLIIIFIAIVNAVRDPYGGQPPAIPVTPTPTQLPTPTPIDFTTDSDNDAIPDNIETQLDYDPNANDCVRQLGCGDFPQLPRAKLRLNIIFIIDASGSMGEQIGDQTKWESAVSALSQVIDSGFPYYTDIGFIVYGHQGSSDVSQKARSCAGVQTIRPLSPLSDQSDPITIVKQFKPTGWTPLAGALIQAQQMLAGREGEGNFVIVLSDGKETCGGDPVAAAQKLHDSGIEVTTNVVGLVVNDDERQQLEAIATSGGGNYYQADNSEEIEQAIFLSSEAVRLWEQINQCIADNASAYSECINLQYLRSVNYVKQQRLDQENQISTQRDLYLIEQLAELERRIWDKLEQLRTDNWDQYKQDLKSLEL